MTAAIGLPPDAVELVPPHSIPKTSSGKLRRDQTRQLYLAGTLGTGAPPPWLQVLRLGAASARARRGRWLRRGAGSLYTACTPRGVCALAGGFVVAAAGQLAPSRAGRGAHSRRRAARVFWRWWAAGCEVRGREHLASGRSRACIVSNHTSYFDVLVLMAALGVDYHFVAKSEVHSMPFIGTFLRKLGHFAFDRADPQARLRQAEQMEEALQQGESVFVFPGGHVHARRKACGPFTWALQSRRRYAGCPVVPVALRGTRRFLRDKTILPRPSRISVTVCPPLISARRPRGNLARGGAPAGRGARGDRHGRGRAPALSRSLHDYHCKTDLRRRTETKELWLRSFKRVASICALPASIKLMQRSLGSGRMGG